MVAAADTERSSFQSAELTARLEPPLFGGRVPTVTRSADWSGVPVAGASRGPLPEQSTAADDAS
ncbi:hypothetical protein GEV33_002643 [Tenebrio molitor]|uniref:Uncharacterized protein n=1 Tax=Tenebrio molitor TaxID=7067 RepID=A0A8J6LIG8_TENMO|nr:hypothetical protein GEV33_002643 [Tenebrio molitor]